MKPRFYFTSFKNISRIFTVFSDPVGFSAIMFTIAIAINWLTSKLPSYKNKSIDFFILTSFSMLATLLFNELTDYIAENMWHILLYFGLESAFSSLSEEQKALRWLKLINKNITKSMTSSQCRYCKYLTLSWRRGPNHIETSPFICSTKSMYWFLYDRDLCHESVFDVFRGNRKKPVAWNG